MWRLRNRRRDPSNIVNQSSFKLIKSDDLGGEARVVPSAGGEVRALVHATDPEVTETINRAFCRERGLVA